MAGMVTPDCYARLGEPKPNCKGCSGKLGVKDWLCGCECHKVYARLRCGCLVEHSCPNKDKADWSGLWAALVMFGGIAVLLALIGLGLRLRVHVS